MSGERIYVTTPVGRLVWGDCFKEQTTDYQGRPMRNQKGEPKTQWEVGIAIPKSDPAWSALWQQMVAVAQRDFPGNPLAPGAFAWKVTDGDGVRADGKPYPDHCKGCFILKASSGFAPNIYNAQNVQIVDPKAVKRGDYVRAHIALQGNDDRSKPGLYVSHSLVQVVGYGEAIQAGPDAATVFAAPAALPPGASSTPVGAAPMPVAPGLPGMPPGMPPIPTAAPALAVPAGPGVAGLPGLPTASPSNPGPAPYPQILQGPGGPLA